MSDFTEKAQFDHLFDALIKQHPGLKNALGKATVFQFSTAPKAARWENSSSIEAYELADGVPAELGGFYTKGSSSLHSAYLAFVASLKPPQGADNTRYQTLFARLDAEEAVKRSLVAEAQSAYNLWEANNTDKRTGFPLVSFREWLIDDFGGSSWGTQLATHKAHLATLTTEIEAIKKAIGDPRAAAITKANDDQYKMNVNYSDGTIVRLPRINISGSLTKDNARWLATPKDQYEFDVRINTAEKTTSPWVTTVETRTTGNCFRLSTETKVDTSRIITDTHYNLRVTAVGLQSYDISRGDWYEDSLVSTDAVIQEGSQLNHNSFFGLKGSLHMIPLTVLVMYKPTVELTVSTQCYRESIGVHVQTSLSWIELFGFRFAVDANKGLNPIDNGNGSMTIRFDSPDNTVPHILGVISKVLYNGKK